jgi:hypothetical protein
MTPPFWSTPITQIAPPPAATAFGEPPTRIVLCAHGRSRVAAAPARVGEIPTSSATSPAAYLKNLIEQKGAAVRFML